MSNVLFNEMGLQNPISKKLPPFARKICSDLKKGVKPKNDIFIFLGKEAWKKANSFLKVHSVVILPNDDNEPKNYLWWFVKKCSVLVFDTSGVGSEIIRSLAYELLKAGALVARVVLVNYKLVVFRQGGDYL